MSARHHSGDDPAIAAYWGRDYDEQAVLEQRATYANMDAVVRVTVPAILTRLGRESDAQRIAALTPLTDEESVIAAADVLGAMRPTEPDAETMGLEAARAIDAAWRACQTLLYGTWDSDDYSVGYWCDDIARIAARVARDRAAA